MVMSRGKIVVKHILVIMIVIFEMAIFISHILRRKEKGASKIYSNFQFSISNISIYFLND